MSVDFGGQSIPMLITEDLSAKKYQFVKVGASDRSVLLNDTAGGTVVGVLQEEVNGGTVNKHGPIRMNGLSKLRLGNTVARGDLIMSDANGKGIPSATAGSFEAAIALESGVADDIILVSLVGSRRHAV